MTKIRCKTDSQMDWEELASKHLVEIETQYKAARTVQYLKKPLKIISMLTLKPSHLEATATMLSTCLSRSSTESFMTK